MSKNTQILILVAIWKVLSRGDVFAAFEVSAYPLDNITEFDIEYMFSNGVPGLRIYRDGIIVHDDGYVMANGALSSPFIKTYSMRESLPPWPPAPRPPPRPISPPRPPPLPRPPPSPPPLPSPQCAAAHGTVLGQCTIYPPDDGLWSHNKHPESKL
jgi:hypothetical protein